MKKKFEEILEQLAAQSNLRTFPESGCGELIDLTSNDYLGIATRKDLMDEFLGSVNGEEMMLTSSASRLLATNQSPYMRLEQLLGELYGGRKALLFNSGYHANTGIVSALADKHTLILADRLVHASIIDGIKLSGATFKRFRHNDFDALEQMLGRESGSYQVVLVIVEGVYSMDGDAADICRLVELKRRYDNVMLYVDEAHSFGVCGRDGLGLVAAADALDKVDVVVGTFGKAAASFGAFAITSDTLKQYLINKSRSLIFSTALPPVSVAWSRFVVERIPTMGAERQTLRRHSERLSTSLSALTGQVVAPSHILPLVVGDASATIGMSRALARYGVKVLPIRTPTVPPGTERLRISLSASLSSGDIDSVISAMTMVYENGVRSK